MEKESRIEKLLRTCVDGSGPQSAEKPKSRIEALLADLSEKIAEEGASTVHYTADTGKTSEQKAQARTNIGAQAETDNNLQTTSKTVVGGINEVNTRVDNVNAIGRFLAYWDCTTGLPLTDPASTPYAYHTGDYFVISNVGATNYKPNGTQYDGTASTTTVTGVAVQDIFRYDGTSWAVAKNTNPDLTAYVATFSQTFTDVQKAQARTNIGAVAASDLAGKVDTSTYTAGMALKQDKAIIKTVLDAILEVNTMYFLTGTPATVALTLPSPSDNAGKLIGVSWNNGSTAATVTISGGSCVPSTLTATASKHTELNFMSDGSVWRMVSNEMAVS